MHKGFWYAVLAYFTWGLFPMYWKALQGIPALQLLGHRIVWSFVFMMILLAVLGQGRAFKAEISSPRILLIYGAAAVFLAVNWLIYVWATITGNIVETSLGYFINPLLSMLLGMAFLRERLRPFQWIPVALAAAGMLYLTFAYGYFPWIALVLACSFGIYGFLQKVAPLSALHSIALETTLLLLPALAYLLAMELSGTGAFLHSGPAINLLLIGAGAVTAVPLLLFAAATQRITLFLVGVLQYIAPSMYFLLGVLLYDEPLTPERLTGFVIIWLALILFAVEGYWNHRKNAANQEPRIMPV
ncbi:MAG: EamA family transporter RarD [Anaerolineales bacterium]|nr:EamA family transporter RarD [Anaerolineales bacterium]